MQPVFQQNSQRRSVRHAELLAVRARVSSQRPFLTGGGFLVLVISCGRDAAKLFPQFPGTGCFLPLAVSYRRPFPVAGRFLRLAHHPKLATLRRAGLTALTVQLKLRRLSDRSEAAMGRHPEPPKTTGGAQNQSSGRRSSLDRQDDPCFVPTRLHTEVQDPNCSRQVAS